MTDSLYTECDCETVSTFRRIHANSEQTHVAVVKLTDDQYAAVAFDTDPRDYSVIDAELIAHSPTRTGAETHATDWLRDNPKGIASGGGVLAGALQKIARLGDQMNDNQQTTEDS